MSDVSVTAGRRPWFRPMRARDADEEHRVATPLELFFDLVFVVAVSQAGAELHHGLAEHRVGRSIALYLMVFFAIWWAWMNFTWFASAYDTDDAPYRVLTLIQMAGALVLAAGVPEAFEHTDFRIVTIGYVIMRVAMVAQWLRAARGDPPRRVVALRYAGGVTAVQVCWVLRLLVPGTLGVVLFFGLAAAEIAAPVWAERGGPQTTWHPGHIADRYGAFTLIVLGETALAATTAIQDAISSGGLSAELLMLSVGGTLIAFTFWWAYFQRDEDAGLGSHPNLPFVWGYGHYLIFAGLAALGAGLQVSAEALEHHEEISAALAATAVAVPVALALAVKSVLVRLLEPGSWRLSISLGMAVALVLLAALAPVLTVGVSVLLMGLTMAAGLILELTRPRRP